MALVRASSASQSKCCRTGIALSDIAVRRTSPGGALPHLAWAAAIETAERCRDGERAAGCPLPRGRSARHADGLGLDSR